ncbi:MAG: hypothetical protein IJU84_03435, partial [Clostridia bacterium]|nr:hypothetical protein [Clostridia bacterium]
MFEKAKWIWISKESVPNERAEFFFTAQVSDTPKDVVVRIGCETKYNLFVNGVLAVFDGGLFRESLPGCGYFDETDITPYIKAGKNEIAVSVRYFGNGGRNNSYCEKPGLIFECEKLFLYSDERVECKRAEGYYNTETENPSYLYGGHNTAYNAQKRVFSACPISMGTTAAVAVGNYGDAPWGKLVKRPVPLLFFTEKKCCAFTRAGDKTEVKLPYAMHCSPWLKVKAAGGEKIDIRTDRYAVNGGPSDSGVYYGHRAEYICATGEQEFEVFDWFFGEKIIFTIPENVEIVSLGYRESGYPARVTGAFECDDPAINRLYEKCVRTLLVCMRENFMDCPDRERGQWIGDVSVQAPQVIYILDENARKLLKKAIFDFIDLRKGDRLVGNVPGDNFSELPSQSLNAISERGMIAAYYEATGDVSVLKKYFRPAAEYLKLWDTDEYGVVTERQGDWKWYDHLFNIDGEILNQCWYYSALKFAHRSADILGDHAYDDFFEKRIKAIEDNFEERYWKGGFYSSGKAVDDRANAMAVLSGLCVKEHYNAVRFVLNEVQNASTYMEGYVLAALCEMGFKEDAFYRMKNRYCRLIENENTTLWEDFSYLGTKNHAWSGSPASILF